MISFVGDTLYKLCAVPSLLQPPYETIAQYCNIWRNYGDIQDGWGSVYSIIDHYGNNTDKFAEIAAPGQFNDPDEVGCLYL